MMATVVPLAIFLAVEDRGLAIGSGGSRPCCSSAAILATLSRGALVGLAALLLWAVLTRRIGFGGTVALVLAALVLIGLAFTLWSSVINERLEEKNQDRRRQRRIARGVLVGRRADGDGPPDARGRPGAFSIEAKNYVRNSPIELEDPLVHNSYLEILAEDGPFALAAVPRHARGGLGRGHQGRTKARSRRDKTRRARLGDEGDLWSRSSPGSSSASRSRRRSGSRRAGGATPSTSPVSAASASVERPAPQGVRRFPRRHPREGPARDLAAGRWPARARAALARHLVEAGVEVDGELRRRRPWRRGSRLPGRRPTSCRSSTARPARRQATRAARPRPRRRPRPGPPHRPLDPDLAAPAARPRVYTVHGLPDPYLPLPARPRPPSAGSATSSPTAASTPGWRGAPTRRRRLAGARRAPAPTPRLPGRAKLEVIPNGVELPATGRGRGGRHVSVLEPVKGLDAFLARGGGARRAAAPGS